MVDTRQLDGWRIFGSRYQPVTRPERDFEKRNGRTPKNPKEKRNDTSRRRRGVFATAPHQGVRSGAAEDRHLRTGQDVTSRWGGWRGHLLAELIRTSSTVGVVGSCGVLALDASCGLRGNGYDRVRGSGAVTGHGPGASRDDASVAMAETIPPRYCPLPTRCIV